MSLFCPIALPPSCAKPNSVAEERWLLIVTLVGIVASVVGGNDVVERLAAVVVATG